jgi:hypothetical protein
MKYLQASLSTCVFSCLLASGCNASDDDCAKLGAKFVELYQAELSEDSKKLAPEVLENAAEAGRAEIVEQCKKERYSKASVDRCLSARTMDEFKKC